MFFVVKFYIIMQWRITMKKTSRNYGIDLLRVFSIFLVVILHILGHGGVIASTASHWHYSAAFLLEILAYPAVNCFVLISGFVGYRGEDYTPKLRNIISIFFTVIFYSVGICVLLQFVNPNFVTLDDIKNSFLPILKEQYWFYSSYFGVFLLSPIINFFVYKASVKQLYLSSLTVFFFSLITLESKAFFLNNGYSVIWFAFVYLLGAVIRKNDIVSKVSKGTCALTLLIAFFCTWIPKVVFPLTENAFLHEHESYFISYTSPTILLMAIAWICLFSKFTFQNILQKFISFFSSSAFSVYLIHDNKHIRNYLMSKSFYFVNQYPPFALILIIIGSGTAILISCTLIDKVRIFLFGIFKIDKLSIILEERIKAIINKGYSRICLRRKNRNETK